MNAETNKLMVENAKYLKQKLNQTTPLTDEEAAKVQEAILFIKANAD